MFREALELLSYHDRFTQKQAKHDYENVYRKVLRDLRPLGFGNLYDKSVLDLGCGQRFPFALLCAAQGAHVTTLDLDYVEPCPLPVYAWQIFRYNGLKRAMKSLIRRLFFDGRYYRSLEQTYGQKLLPYSGVISFVVADPHYASYPLPDDSFDLIVANAVVEHVVDVESMVSEIRRLLSVGGYFYAIIHNFYSLSGGHNLEWAYPDEHPSDRVPPWDHLGKNRCPCWTYLNRLRPEEYRQAFGNNWKSYCSKGETSIMILEG